MNSEFIRFTGAHDLKEYWVISKHTFSAQTCNQQELLRKHRQQWHSPWLTEDSPPRLRKALTVFVDNHQPLLLNLQDVLFIQVRREKNQPWTKHCKINYYPTELGLPTKKKSRDYKGDMVSFKQRGKFLLNVIEWVIIKDILTKAFW
jgi:hypothetical protein